MSKPPSERFEPANFGFEPDDSNTANHNNHQREASFVLSLYQDGEADRLQARKALYYLKTCAKCRQIYQSYGAIENSLQAYLQAVPPPPPLPNVRANNAASAKGTAAPEPVFAATRRSATRPRGGFAPFALQAGMVATTFVLIVILAVVFATAKGDNPIATSVSGVAAPTDTALSNNFPTRTTTPSGTIGITLTEPSPTASPSPVITVAPTEQPTVNIVPTVTPTPQTTAASVPTATANTAPVAATNTPLPVPTITPVPTNTPAALAPVASPVVITVTVLVTVTNTPNPVATNTPQSSVVAATAPTGQPQGTATPTTAPVVTPTLLVAATATPIITPTNTVAPTVTPTVAPTTIPTPVVTTQPLAPVATVTPTITTPDPTTPLDPVNALADGQIAYINKVDGEIYLIKSDGTGNIALSVDSVGKKVRWHNIVWSNDGRSLAAAALNTETGKNGIYLFQTNKPPTTTLDLVAEGISPVWSPDDKALAFLATPNSSRRQDGFTAVVNLSSRSVSILDDEPESLSPQWLDDGKRVLSGQDKVISLDAKFYNRFDVFENSCAGSSLSPSGNLLAVLESGSDGTFTPLIYDLDNPVVRKQPTIRFSKISVSGKVGQGNACGSYRIRWTNNSQYFFFYHRDGNAFETCLVGVKDGSYRCLTNIYEPSFNGQVTTLVDIDSATGNLYIIPFGNRPAKLSYIGVIRDNPVWRPGK